jgi:tetratricopeptide (TPR) repeat protein
MRRAAAALVLGVVASVSARAAPWLTASSVIERADHVDVAVEFGCALRYAGHSPGSQGSEIRIQFQAGAGCALPAQFAVERLLPANDEGLVRDIEFSPGLAGGAELRVAFNRQQQFVVAPAAGMRGFRIRVLRPKQSGAAVLINDAPGAVGTYAVNLSSALTPPEPQWLSAAAEVLKAPVYVSEAQVEGQTWYRLRAGPFSERMAAERVLQEALRSYPKAWLAVEDEQDIDGPESEVLPAPAAAVVPRPGGGEVRADESLDARLVLARKALAARRFDEAIQGLTQILRSPDYLKRAEAQEMLGLARERNSQLAHAKAEYEEYLRRYPQGAAVARVRQRLRLLRTAALPGRQGSGGGEALPGDWRLQGSMSALYRRDDTQLKTTAAQRDLVSQNALLGDWDVVARRHGERHDFVLRSSAGYLKDLTPQGSADRMRVSSAYGEWRDREQDITARLGRQSRGMAGIFGLFDGGYGSWQATPQFGFDVAAGMPVETSREGPDTQRQFAGMAASYRSPNHRWEGSVYAIGQQYHGVADRRSVGFDSRYFQAGRSLVALVDYDLHYAQLNLGQLVGTLVLPSNWTFSADLGRQRSPVLSLRNALIGQPVSSFDTLMMQFPREQLEQWAQDRSATVTQGSLSASRPWGDRAQWTLTASTVDIGGTPASGGVEAIGPAGREDALQGELMVNSLLLNGDLTQLTVRHQRGPLAQTSTLGIGNRWPLGNAWRLTTRLRGDYRNLHDIGQTQWLLLPSLRADYRRGQHLLDIEAGAELGRRDGTTGREESQRFFVSVGYRWMFDEVWR